MLTLIQRYTETAMDQWELWRMPSTVGDVFIDVRRATPSPGYKVESYADMAQWVASRD